MDEYVIKIRPLTPIWTGDEHRKCLTIRETGIIGSLRWWYEALIRGLGGDACDPTNEKSRCKLNQDKWKEAIKSGKAEQDALNEQICSVCQLFGCTGWARKFKLEIKADGNLIPEVWIETREKRQDRYLKRNIYGFMSNDPISFIFIPLKKINKDEWGLLNTTLKIIADYGALGAHTSQGNGVIKIIENYLPQLDKNPKIMEVKEERKDTLPNLKDFFFYKFHIEFKENISNLINKNVFWTHASNDKKPYNQWNKWENLWQTYHLLPIAFHIRDILRGLESNKDRRDETFGKMGKGSKVFGDLSRILCLI